jgi:phage terminase small subunit
MPSLDNQRHEAFAQALAKGSSATDAYVTAGYRPSRTAASRLSSNVNVQLRVKELLTRAADRAEIDIARTLKELVRLGTSDVRRFFDESGKLLPVHALDDETAAAVASVEVVTKTIPGGANEELEGQPQGGALKRNRGAEVEYLHKIKLWDKNSALEKIAKHLGMFIDRVEHTGKDGEEIRVASVDPKQLSTKTLTELMNARRAAGTKRG